MKQSAPVECVILFLSDNLNVVGSNFAVMGWQSLRTKYVLPTALKSIWRIFFNWQKQTLGVAWVVMTEAGCKDWITSLRPRWDVRYKAPQISKNAFELDNIYSPLQAFETLFYW